MFVTKDDITSFSIFDESYFYNVKYLGYEFCYTNEKYIDSVHHFKFYVESHGKIYCFDVAYGLIDNEYALTKLELREIKRRLNKLKTGYEIPNTCKKKYAVNEHCDVINADFFVILFNTIMDGDFFCSKENSFINGTTPFGISQNDFADFINSKRAKR